MGSLIVERFGTHDRGHGRRRRGAVPPARGVVLPFGLVAGGLVAGGQVAGGLMAGLFGGSCALPDPPVLAYHPWRPWPPPWRGQR